MYRYLTKKWGVLIIQKLSKLKGRLNYTVFVFDVSRNCPRNWWAKEYGNDGKLKFNIFEGGWDDVFEVEFLETESGLGDGGLGWDSDVCGGGVGYADD
jgi:hypothetical protein